MTPLLKFSSFEFAQFWYRKHTDCSTTFQTKFMTVKNKTNKKQRPVATLSRICQEKTVLVSLDRPKI